LRFGDPLGGTSSQTGIDPVVTTGSFGSSPTLASTNNGRVTLDIVEMVFEYFLKIFLKRIGHVGFTPGLGQGGRWAGALASAASGG